MSEGSTMVMQDAQASLFSVLRPYPTFVADYQGKAGSTPVMFTEGGIVLDPRAGQAGYSPNLLNGFQVPLGARMIAWLPLASFFRNNSGQSELYNWFVIWRIRNTRDYLESRSPFHYPKEGVGTANLVVLPACFESVIYDDPAPMIGEIAGGAGVVQRPARSVVNVSVFQPGNIRQFNQNAIGVPLLPGAIANTAVMQQGTPAPTVASYVTVDVTAMGDDMLLACVKDDPQQAGVTWDFAGDDLGFAQIYGSGNPDLGVYVQVVVPSP